MNSCAARIDGRHAGGSQHNKTLGYVAGEVLKESSFSCTRLSGKEHRLIGTPHIPLGRFKYAVLYNIHIAPALSLQKYIQTGKKCQPCLNNL